MKKFALKTKGGEIVNKISSEDRTTAIKHFAELKKLRTDVLLNIFDVDFVQR